MGEGGPAQSRLERILDLPFDSVEDLTDAFCAVLFSKLEPGDQAGKLVLLSRATDCLALKFARTSTDVATAGEFTDDDPAATLIGWIRHDCKMQFGAAVDRVMVGEQLSKLDKSANAVRKGEIGFAHLVAMAKLLSQISRPNLTVDIPSLEDELLDMARESTPGRFWHLTKRVLHAINAEFVAGEQRFRAEERYLRFADMQDGSVAINGRLDSIGAAGVRTALEPLSHRSGEGDNRGIEQRQADALVEMSMQALDSGQLPHSASQRPHLQVTTTLETLCGKPGAPAAEMEFSEPISWKTVQRLACDASISRVIFGEGSVIVDAGRARRVVSGATRRVLNARDQHCQWPGCERPATWSAAHHLVHWTQGGSTDLSNLIVLCHRHHWAVHEGGWNLARASDNRLLVIPPTYNYFHPTRAPDKPAAA